MGDIKMYTHYQGDHTSIQSLATYHQVERDRQFVRRLKDIGKLAKLEKIFNDIFTIVLQRNSVGTCAKIGIAIDKSNNVSLRIAHIYGKGCFSEWNAEHPEARVNTGDHIIMANGIGNNASAMELQLYELGR